MSEKNNEKEIRHYCAFISYRHKPLDMQAAKKVQAAIERYVIPKELRKSPEQKKFGYVFRDEDELPVGSSLSDSIIYALDHTDFLIVICTPDLPESKWCEQEITYFLKTHDRSHVLAVLADGDPEKSFSPYLLHTYDEDGNILSDVEPLAANIAGENHTISRKNFSREITRIYAAMLDVPFDTLWQRERRARTARVTGVLSVVIAGLSIFLGVTLRQNAVISEQNRQQKIQLSSMLVDSGTEQLAEYHPKEALSDVLSALSDRDPAIYDHRAEKLLTDVTHAYWRGDVQVEAVYEQSTPIRELLVTADATKAVIIDPMGYVRCVDTATGECLWQSASWEDGQDDGDEFSRLLLSESAGVVLCKNSGNLCALSLADGSMLWNLEQELEGYFAVLSDDGQKAAFLEQQFLYGEDGFYDQTEIVFVDVATGEETGRVHFLDDTKREIESAYTTHQTYGGAFSESGRYFGFGLCEKVIEDSIFDTDEDTAETDDAGDAADTGDTADAGDASDTGEDATDAGDGANTGEDAKEAVPEDDAYVYYVIDTQTMEVIRRWQTTVATSASQLFYGIHVNEETLDLFVVQYSPVHGAIISGVCYGDDPKHTEFYSHGYELRANNGEFYMWLRAGACPILCNDDLALVTSESTLLIYGLSDGMLRKSYDMSGTILDIFWEDAEEDQVCLLLSDGGIAEYDLISGDEGAIEGYWLYSMAQSGLALGKHTAESSYKDAVFDWITVREDVPGELLVSSKAEDENAILIPKPEGIESNTMRVLTEPSGEFFFILYDPGPMADKKVTAVRYRAADLSEDARCTLDFAYVSSFSAEPMALNAEEILYHDTIYGMDGSVRLMENVTEDNRTLLQNLHKTLYVKRLEDGSVLSAADLSGGSSPSYNVYWLDGMKVPKSEETTIALQGRSALHEVGANGLVVTYGYEAVRGENDEAIVSDTQRFLIRDVINDVRYDAEDRFPESSGRIAAVADAHPWFACAYENGQICLYDLEADASDTRVGTAGKTTEDTASVKTSGGARLLPEALADAAYSPGEIRDLVFASQDQYLVVLTESGRVDVYQTLEGRLLFSETFPVLFDRTWVTIRSASVDGANNRLLLLFTQEDSVTGYMLGIDLQAWVVSLETDGTYGWIPELNRICYPSEEGLVVFPTYSMEDLIGRAEAARPDEDGKEQP